MAQTVLSRSRLQSDSAEYHTPAHTVQTIETVGVRRSSTDDSHRAQLKLAHGKLNVDGVPEPKNLIIECYVRRPYAYTDAEWDNAVLLFLDVFNSADFQAEAKAGRLLDSETVTVGTV